MNPTATALKAIADAVNHGQKADRLRVYNRALGLWRERPERTEMIWVYVGYDKSGAVYRRLEQNDFTDAIGRFSLFVGHTYRVYIQYTPQMRYVGLAVIDADALHAPSGRTFKIGEMSL